MSDTKTKTVANQSSGTTYKLRKYKDISLKRLHWYWKERVYAKGITVIVGIGGRGKSTLSIYLAALFSNGEADGDYKGKKVAVFIASAEDTSEEIIGPRLAAAGANTDHVFELRMSKDGGDADRLLVIPQDITEIKQAINDTMATGAYEGVVVIIDPFKAHLHMGTDSNSETHMRHVLAALASVAEDTGAAIVLIDHPNKRSDALDLASRISGAGTYNAVRSVLLFGKDPDNPDSPTLRLLAQGKHNWSAGGQESDVMELIPERVMTDDGMVDTVKLAYVEPSKRTDADILEAEAVKAGKDNYKWSKSAAVEHFVLGLLWDGRKVPAEDAKEWTARVAQCAPKTVERVARGEAGRNMLAPLLIKDEVTPGKYVWRLQTLTELDAEELPF